MNLHCIRKDTVGLGTLVLVYLAMTLGNLLFIFSVIYPTAAGNVAPNAGMVIESMVFETIWLLMVWCHSYTMFVQPGYIPLNYRYLNEKLPEQFKQFFESKNDEEQKVEH